MQDVAPSSSRVRSQPAARLLPRAVGCPHQPLRHLCRPGPSPGEDPRSACCPRGPCVDAGLDGAGPRRGFALTKCLAGSALRPGCLCKLLYTTWASQASRRRGGNLLVLDLPRRIGTASTCIGWAAICSHLSAPASRLRAHSRRPRSLGDQRHCEASIARQGAV